MAGQSQLLGADDVQRAAEVQSHLCTLLQSTVKKTGRPGIALADRTMQVALMLLQTGASSRRYAELEDVLLLIGALAGEMEGDFVRFAAPLIALLVPLLQAHQDEPSLAIVGYGLVGDLARALGPLLLPHAQALMGALVAGLHSPALGRSVKPHIVSALGDVAMATGGAFAPYLDVAMGLLCQAAKIAVLNPSDYDEIDFVVLLRESLLEAFTCIVQGFRDDANAAALLPFLGPIVEFLQAVAADPERTDTMARSAAGLIGDLVGTFTPHMIPVLSAAWLLAFLQAPLPSRTAVSPNTEATVRWAQQTIQKARTGA
jgi:importin subunit beta-1